MANFDIANVVGTITFPQELALEPLRETLSNREEVSSVTFEPERNHWLQTRWKPNDTYAAFYLSGRCSIAGCDSIEAFFEEAERVDNVMREILGYAEEPDIVVSNIVATADGGKPINLELLAIELGFDRTEYEPEQFPAIIYRAEHYVMLVFSSGRLLCTGLTEPGEISNAFNSMVDQISDLSAQSQRGI